MIPGKVVNTLDQNVVLHPTIASSCMQNPRQGLGFSQMRLCLFAPSIFGLVNNDARPTIACILRPRLCIINYVIPIYASIDPSDLWASIAIVSGHCTKGIREEWIVLSSNMYAIT